MNRLGHLKVGVQYALTAIVAYLFLFHMDKFPVFEYFPEKKELYSMMIAQVAPTVFIKCVLIAMPVIKSLLHFISAINGTAFGVDEIPEAASKRVKKLDLMFERKEISTDKYIEELRSLALAEDA